MALAAEQESVPATVLAVPAYLERVYWWAYVHPNAVRVFERQWLVNLILWGNFARLRNAALNEVGHSIAGRTLQIACVYGDFSEKLADRIAAHGTLDIIDILPIQLRNTRRKLHPALPVRLLQRDSAALDFAAASYDQAIIFFLLHEQPAAVRRETLREALRVLRPGGKLVIVDYHRPRRRHPLRYLFAPVLHFLEPFALDLWHHELAEWLPDSVRPEQIQKQTYFGGLYQKLVVVV